MGFVFLDLELHAAQFEDVMFSDFVPFILHRPDHFPQPVVCVVAANCAKVKVLRVVRVLGEAEQHGVSFGHFGFFGHFWFEIDIVATSDEHSAFVGIDVLLLD